MPNVSVSLNADNQIEVHVGSESRAGECYYLGLQPNSENYEFLPVVGAIQLVGEWIRLLIELKDGQQMFVPFDFSDESTRWLTMLRDGRDVTIVFGWAPVEGWLISPRDLSKYAFGLPSFMPDEPLLPQTFYLPLVLSNLRQSLANLTAQTSHSEILRCSKNY
ncbi:MAG: hypothetical protein DWI22_15605 [Planctomycetota bacterium]|nr:hypothetical protein [Planctomycetales bacterium]RLT04751.1 MAG: hypothetical protein DWI22_15605 [Planctomycetota bacterium]